MRPLALHETHSVAVSPRVRYYPSGIELTPGASYRFAARGKWKDGCLPACGPEGWRGFFLQAWNRLPGRPFFLLCGAVGQDLERAFAVGAALDWSAPAEIAALPDRQLYFFANDWPSRYGNNHALPEKKGGPLRVSISRLT